MSETTRLQAPFVNAITNNAGIAPVTTQTTLEVGHVIATGTGELLDASVTNTGTVDLADVEVTDPLAAACDAVIGALAAGASDTYTCTVPAGYPADTTNVADVTGDPVDANGDPLPVPPVTDDDPADVDIVNPAIRIADSGSSSRMRSAGRSIAPSTR